MNYGPAHFYEENQRHVRLCCPVLKVPRQPKPRPRPPEANHAAAIATLKDHLVGAGAITLHSIIRAICIVKNVAANEFLSRTRVKKITDAKQLYHYLARELLQLSYPTIGARCGIHHTTVMHGYRKIKANLAKYADDIVAAKKLLWVE